MSAFPCRLLTPERTEFEGAVEAAVLPGAEGTFGVLARHAPLVALLGRGVVRLRTGEGERGFEVPGGFARVEGGALTLLCPSASPAGGAALGRLQ